MKASMPRDITLETRSSRTDSDKQLKKYDETVVIKQKTAYENRLKQIIKEARAKGTKSAHKILEPLIGEENVSKITSGGNSSLNKSHSRTYSLEQNLISESAKNKKGVQSQKSIKNVQKDYIQSNKIFKR